jgi:uroporphyrinogen-III synthase
MHKPKLPTSLLLARRVLLTRPCAKSRELTKLLSEKEVFSLSHPLVEIHAINNIDKPTCIDEADIVIAISENAVRFARQQISNWPKNVIYLAVGSATQSQFTTLGIAAETPDYPTTEGLLKLACLSQVHNKNVTIIRGQGGREVLAQTLIQRGASVSYLEVYQRQLIDMNPPDCELQWQQYQINTIVVTSGEILLHIYANVGEKSLSWLQDLWLVVPSERIATMAKNLGASNVSISHGADNESIVKILLN